MKKTLWDVVEEKRQQNLKRRAVDHAKFNETRRRVEKDECSCKHCAQDKEKGASCFRS